MTEGRPAFVALFDAYLPEREKADAWYASEVLRITTAVPGAKVSWYRDDLRLLAANSLAQCIAVVGDNFARMHAHHLFSGDEDRREECGSEVVPGLRFGAVLKAAANAARHHAGKPFRPKTEAVLQALGIEQRYAGATFRVLEVAGIKTLDDLERELDQVAADLEALAGSQGQLSVPQA